MTTPLPSPDDAGYRGLVRQLAGLAAAAAEDRAEAGQWHDDKVAAAADKLRAAEEDMHEAEQRYRAARKAREGIEAEVADAWNRYIHDTGGKAERFGRTAPEPAIPRQRDRDAHEYLEQAAASARVKAAPARPLTGATTIMFAAFGFLGGACGVAAHQILRWAGREAGGDWAVGLPVMALIVMLLGPILAVFGAKRVADRRGVGLDATAVATVLVTGLFTAALLWAAVRQT
ncbi:hypothetical protein [Actinoplanes sp. NBRC 103695]|uniref:hypothetical protein n=1 Tax=Actinoplanes sp. NBRC 103695 TaxID=3032202 RepID=UPI0024A2F462|nr:hypothetical protein [Actinoplanes sp. NBRC 103695]GLZ00543.1 hypothetical protein Acsp02_77950 [Actinoplanes sp. NBRC 103695]